MTRGNPRRAARPRLTPAAPAVVPAPPVRLADGHGGRQAPLPIATPSVDRLDALFKGFADPTRLRILNMLAAGELCVCDLVGLLGLPQPTVSRHLAYLRRTGLVTMSRAWKFAHYRLADPAHPVHATLLGCVRSCFHGIPTLDAERAAAEACVSARASDAANACR